MEGWDQQGYRGAGEVDTLRAEHDCVRVFTDRVVKAGSLAWRDLVSVDREVRASVDTAVAEARDAKDPDIEELHTDVYVTY